MPLTLTSPVFQDGDVIPAKYTYPGGNITPPLQWEDAPPETKSFVIIFDGPESPAGLAEHWVLYNIPGDTYTLPENSDYPAPPILVGQNSWGSENYRGPNPTDTTHRYRIHLFALDTTLSLSAGAERGEVEQAMLHHVVSRTKLMGRVEPNYE